MNIPLFVVLLFFLQFLYWLVGKRASKNLNTSCDYFLAGKSVRLWPLMMTFLATQVGGGLVLGAAEEAYHYGWSVLFYPLGASLGLILLGAGVGQRLARFKVSTVAQIFEVVYSSSNLKKIASLLSVISLFMILVAQIIASAKFLASLGITSNSLFVAFWATVILYTVQGGLRAVIATDIVQALFFSLVFIACFGFVYTQPSTPIVTWIDTGISTKMCGWLFMPLLFMLIEQDMGQRCFAGDSPKIVSLATLIAGIITMIVCIVPIYFGTLAKTLGLEIPSGTSVLMFCIEKTTNPWISAIVGCAVLAAIISTATSLINAIGSNISNDFKFSFLKRKEVIPIVQGIICTISLAAILVAFFFDSIVDVLMQSYELSVSCLFVPLFYALIKKHGNAKSAWISVSFGAMSFILLRRFPIPFPKEIASVILSFVGYWIGEMIEYRKSLRFKNLPQR
ncbi:MAG TPA: sodium:solute symporter family protein [Chlamydiales bacterium]|nr:sodium:solute symporter family protein [Chlamydiales bacterium]